MDIPQLRKSMREKRRLLSQAEQQESETLLAQRLLKQVISKQTVKRIAIYLSNDGEISTQGFIQSLWQQNIEVYLPVIHPFNAGNLLFLQYKPNTKMTKNKYGIDEPTLDVRYVCPASELDIIFTPLVAFDSDGNRMGMGGGYYDRTLAGLSQVSTIGLAHDCQQVDKLETQPWDIPLDCIITPSQQIHAK